MKNVEMTRFDARITKEQKSFFEYASTLGGFRNLTEFVLKAAQTKAEEIVAQHNKIIASKRDQEIFFDLLFEEKAPNQELKDALTDFNKRLENG
ncbi:MAG: DUF1778 domain-containing protein [Bacteroidota bacterium]